MKAIIRGAAGLSCLLLLASVSHAWYYATAVYKCPFPQAPDCYGPGYYAQGPQGMWYGPNYYLVPPTGPFNGVLPGPTGQAIMSGYLPHKLLLSKDGLAIGNVPLLGQKQGTGGEQPPYPTPGAGLPQLAGGAGPAGMAYGSPNGGMQSPYGGMPFAAPPPRPPYSGMPWSGPMPNGAIPQMPMGPMPMMPYGAMPPPMPYGTPMMPPYGAPQMPYPMPNGSGVPMPYPMRAPVPQMPMAGYYPARRDPATGLWLVQNTVPAPGGGQFMPIPGFNGPMMPQQPGMAQTPISTFGPADGFQYFGPMQSFTPLQGPQMPRMDAAPMQAPRMEMNPPPPMPRPAGYPTHPFVRSPRDFFMWGETMEEERARGSRPNPVP